MGLDNFLASSAASSCAKMFAVRKKDMQKRLILVCILRSFSQASSPDMRRCCNDLRMHRPLWEAMLNKKLSARTRQQHQYQIIIFPSERLFLHALPQSFPIRIENDLCVPVLCSPFGCCVIARWTKLPLAGSS